MSALGISLLSGLSGKCVSDSATPVVSSPTRLSCGIGIPCMSLTSYRPLSWSMPKRLSLRATSISLLSGAIAVSHTSGTMLPIVAETRPVDASATLAMSVSIASADFVQTKDCIAMLAQLRTINAIPWRTLYIFHCSNTVLLSLTHYCIEVSLKRHRSSPWGPGPLWWSYLYCHNCTTYTI